MIEIVHSGLKEKYLEGIKRNLRQKDAVFTRLPDVNIKSLISEKRNDALIIGEEINNPIRLAQEAYSFDKYLSILIIAEPSHYKNLKQALLFTPFIGSSVNCISDGDDLTVAHKVDDLIKKTHQRRNFQDFKKVEIPVHMSPKIEVLKKEYINKFFEKAPVGAILLDHDSNILGLNYQASVILQGSETELLGNSLARFFLESEQNSVKEFLDGLYIFHPKKNFLRSLGPEQHVEIAVTEVKLDEKNNYKIAILNDITETVIKDRQIQNQLADLKKINTDLDNFIYTASHDLKAPISNIEGLIYAIKDASYSNQNPEEQKHFLNMLEKSILRLSSTIQDLADIAKIQKNIDDNKDLVNIPEIVEEVLESMEKEILTSFAKINKDFGNCNNVYTSKLHLRSIVYNLISNAVKYRSPDRVPLIDIKCRDVKDFIVIDIIDNGLGISKTNQEKMFSMFKRFHDHVDGTGIGLYIVKRIIDNSGGKIEVESEENKGTTFTIYLPKAKAINI